jgi:polyisoprenoid-binding protein YceI
MKKTLALPALTAAALLLPACATLLQAVAGPVTKDPARVIPGTYAVEPYHTQVLFSVLHFGFTNYYGTFSGASGTLTVVPQKPADMVVNISVPVASVATTSTKLDEELKTADWLDAAHFPAMEFHSTSVTVTSPTTADVAGNLSLHGITKPLTLHATFIGAGTNVLDHKETVGFQLTGTLNRSDFGVAKYVPLVSDEVTLLISAAFEKQ